MTNAIHSREDLLSDGNAEVEFDFSDLIVGQLKPASDS